MNTTRCHVTLDVLSNCILWWNLCDKCGSEAAYALVNDLANLSNVEILRNKCSNEKTTYQNESFSCAASSEPLIAVFVCMQSIPNVGCCICPCVAWVVSRQLIACHSDRMRNETGWDASSSGCPMRSDIWMLLRSICTWNPFCQNERANGVLNSTVQWMICYKCVGPLCIVIHASSFHRDQRIDNHSSRCGIHIAGTWRPSFAFPMRSHLNWIGAPYVFSYVFEDLIFV